MDLNPFSFEFHEDPYPTYRSLRDHAPCYRNEELGFWALTRYADVLAASRDWQTFSSADGPMIEKTDRAFIEALPMMISLDPPDHERLRALVSRAFTPTRVAALEPEIRRLAAGYLDAMRETGGGDVVKHFTAPLPMDVIFIMLGVDEADRLPLRHHIDVSLERDQDNPGIPRRAIEAMSAQASYWFDLVKTRRHADGADDLISALLAADLTDREVVGFLMLLSAAGNETVTKLLANAIVLLDRHPEQRAALVADPSAIPAAVEETLRYWPPSQYQGRTATTDVTFHGETIPAGDRVILVTGAANRDEREYDDPDRFDITRDSHVALGFGYGVHFCLGAALARLESRVGLEEFLVRFPEYSVDEAGLRRVHMSNVHGFESVPVSA